MTGHYNLRVLDESKFVPKVFGGLGLFWLYNSQEVTGKLNVTFSGLGPEFGFGLMYELTPNIQLDFTSSIRFALYNEYKVSGNAKTPIGIDQQYICFNLAVNYIYRLVK